MTRYYPRDEVPQSVYGRPDHAHGGWEYAVLSDLAPSPIGMVAVAANYEEGHEQADVALFQDTETPAPTAGMRVRVGQRAHRAQSEDPESLSSVLSSATELDGVEYLRLSAYGPWSTDALIAALRDAADMLEASRPSADTAPGNHEA